MLGQARFFALLAVFSKGNFPKTVFHKKYDDILYSVDLE